jgi:hypothetical protein
LLDEWRYASTSGSAAAEQLERGSLDTLLRLTLLVPDIVETLVDGRPSPELESATLLRPLPNDWF